MAFTRDIESHLIKVRSRKIGTYTPAIARSPVGAYRIIRAHIRFTEKMQLTQVSPIFPDVQHSPKVEGAILY